MKQKLFYFRKSFFFIGLILLFFCILLFTLWKIKPLFLDSTKLSFAELADEIVKNCKDVKYRPTCYEKQIPLLMDPPQSLSMQEAFEVTDLIQKKDTAYAYCHVTGHLLSEKEVKKSPEDWKRVITKCPVAGCANGCIHGVFMEKFNAEQLTDDQIQQLIPELSTVCEKNEFWQPTASETYGCYHALGHAIMYLTNADVKKSIDFCYKVGKKDSNFTSYFNCYQGLFMQIFQPLENEDKLLVKNIRPKKEDVPSFCGRTKDLSRIACLNQSWPYFYSEFKQPEKLNTFCQYYEPQFKEYCYGTVINILTSNTNLDTDFILNYCSSLSSPEPGKCLGQSAARMIEINVANAEKAVSLCEKGQSVDPENNCYIKLLEMSKEVFRNPEKERPIFCQTFPQSWKNICIGN
jgi:hypothetical protein